MAASSSTTRSVAPRAAAGGLRRAPRVNRRASDMRVRVGHAPEPDQSLPIDGGLSKRHGPGFSSRRRLSRRNRGPGGDRTRQEDAEHRAAGLRGIDLDPAVVVLDDAVADRQAQARPLPRVLGGEERLEDLVAIGRGDAAAGVGDRQHHVFGGRRQVQPALAPHDLLGRDAQRPAAGHGVDRVRDQVQADLLDLIGIAGDLGRRRRRAELDLDADAPDRLARRTRAPRRRPRPAGRASASARAAARSRAPGG